MCGMKNQRTSSVPDLWTCPRCGRPFARPYQWHSCGRYSVESFLQGKSAGAIELVDRFAELVESRGRVTVAPAKNRIGFQARIIFAAVNRLNHDSLAAHVVLSRRLESPRLTRIETLSLSSHVHYFRITSLEELDDEVRGWLCQAYVDGGGEPSPG
jgi:hypothetical protein